MEWVSFGFRHFPRGPSSGPVLKFAKTAVVYVGKLGYKRLANGEFRDEKGHKFLTVTKCSNM